MNDSASAVIAFVEAFGVPVFPCKPDGKAPCVPHGFKEASKAPEQIRRWAGRYRGCNWAMPTGAVSGFNVIDVDVRPEEGKYGDETLRALQARHGALPNTATVLTPQNGWHLWFRTNALAISSGTDKLGNGLDVKAEGGYVMIPPSVFKGKAYSWEASSDPVEVGFADMPGWLVALLTAKPAETKPAERAERRARGTMEWLQNVAAGTALHDSLRDLAMHYAGAGLGSEEIRELLEGLMGASQAPRDERWRERLGEIPKLVSSAIEKAHKSADWPRALDLEALAGREPEPPNFIMQGWLPCGYACLFAGHGGVGKSGLALHLAVCMAAGIPFFGLEVERRCVLYASCEDRENILHWRLARICRYEGLNLADLRGNLQALDLVGKDSVLWERDPQTGLTLPAAYFELKARVELYGTEVLMLDGVSDTYGGNENSRPEVKRFVNAQLALIPPATGAALLIGHISKAKFANDTLAEGYSGSTAWHNSVRARWYLYPETEPAESETGIGPNRMQPTGNLILELQKSNFGPIDQTMTFAWDEGAKMFLAKETIATRFDRTHRDTEERDAILRAIEGCARVGIEVPAASSGPRTTLHVLRERPEFPPKLGVSRGSRGRFWRQIEQLRQFGSIAEQQRRKADRHLTTVLVPTGKALEVRGFAHDKN